MTSRESFPRERLLADLHYLESTIPSDASHAKAWAADGRRRALERFQREHKAQEAPQSMHGGRGRWLTHGAPFAAAAALATLVAWDSLQNQSLPGAEPAPPQARETLPQLTDARSAVPRSPEARETPEVRTASLDRPEASAERSEARAPRDAATPERAPSVPRARPASRMVAMSASDPSPEVAASEPSAPDTSVDAAGQPPAEPAPRLASAPERSPDLARPSAPETAAALALSDQVQPAVEPSDDALELLLASPILLIEPTPEQLRELQTQRGNDASKFLPQLRYDMLDPCVEGRTLGAAVDAGEREDARAYVDGQCRGF